MRDLFKGLVGSLLFLIIPAYNNSSASRSYLSSWDYLSENSVNLFDKSLA